MTLGGWFADRVTSADAVVAVASAALVAFALELVGGLVVPVAAIGTLLAGCVVAGIVVAFRGRLDGDGMGALVELSVMAGLMVAALVS